MARSGNRTRGKVIYFTADEWAAVEAAAVAAGLPAGRYIREAALAPKVAPERRRRRGGLTDDAVHQLARIGNNINQLAHEANAARFPSAERLADVLAEVLAAVERLGR